MCRKGLGATTGESVLGLKGTLASSELPRGVGSGEEEGVD